MQDNTLHDQQDHTKGSILMPMSPFTSQAALTTRLTIEGKPASDLMRDPRGRWWIARRIGHMCLPDIDATLALVLPARYDDEPASGNYRADEVAEMRHPIW